MADFEVTSSLISSHSSTESRNSDEEKVSHEELVEAHSDVCSKIKIVTQEKRNLQKSLETALFEKENLQLELSKAISDKKSPEEKIEEEIRDEVTSKSAMRPTSSTVDDLLEDASSSDHAAAMALLPFL